MQRRHLQRLHWQRRVHSVPPRHVLPPAVRDARVMRHQQHAGSPAGQEEHCIKHVVRLMMCGQNTLEVHKEKLPEKLQQTVFQEHGSNLWVHHVVSVPPLGEPNA